MRSVLLNRLLPLFFLGGSLHGAEWVSLFDGQSLAGWKSSVPGAADFLIQEGTIVSWNLGTGQNCVLCTERDYGDFIFEFEFKNAIGKNSGVQLRSTLTLGMFNGHIQGYQMEIEGSIVGGTGRIWDENRRGFLNNFARRPDAVRAFKPNDWNRGRIEAMGDSIKIWVNDVLTTDLRDSMTLSGVIGLQAHPRYPDKVTSFRNLRIQDLGKHEWESLFDGVTLEGWHPSPGSDWKVVDGTIVGTRPKGETAPSLLVSDLAYNNFTIATEFRVIQGRGGLRFRMENSEDTAHAKGLHIELAPNYETSDLKETGGRGWLVRQDPRDLNEPYKRGDWNLLTLSVHGNRVVIQINWATVTDFEDDQIPKDGHLALELHGSEEAQVAFKDIAWLVPTKP